MAGILPSIVKTALKKWLHLLFTNVLANIITTFLAFRV